jgi:hypothetical protein
MRCWAKVQPEKEGKFVCEKNLHRPRSPGRILRDSWPAPPSRKSADE